MPGAWTDNGPISLPSRPLAYGAGLAIVLLAFAGASLGLQASLRKAAAPGLEAAAGSAAGKDDALIAKPIVDLAPPAPPPNEAGDPQADAENDAAKADALAAQTAQAQSIQAKPSKPGDSIDDVLASPSEKPAAPGKGPAEDAPPGAPVKSDVPF